MVATDLGLRHPEHTKHLNKSELCDHSAAASEADERREKRETIPELQDLSLLLEHDVDGPGVEIARA